MMNLVNNTVRQLFKSIIFHMGARVQTRFLFVKRYLLGEFSPTDNSSSPNAKSRNFFIKIIHRKQSQMFSFLCTKHAILIQGSSKVMSVEEKAALEGMGIFLYPRMGDY